MRSVGPNRRNGGAASVGIGAVRWIRGLLAVAVPLVLTGLLAGCDAGSGVVYLGATDGPFVTPSDFEIVPGCPPIPVGGRLPADSVPTAAVTCVGGTEQVPGDGEWSVAVTSRATAGLAALVAALRLPSKPPTNGACTADRQEPTVVLLQVGTRTLVVASPVDECGQPRSEVQAAFSALTWFEVSRKRVARIQGVGGTG